MSLRVDLRRSVGAATLVLGRQPILFAAPLTVLWVTAWSVTWLIERTGLNWLIGLAGLVGLFLSQILTYAIEVGLSAMFLHARMGARANFADGRGVLRYPGLHAYLWELIGKYLAWGLVALIGIFLLLMAGSGLYSISPQAMIDHFASGTYGRMFFAAPCFIIVAFVFNRYQFALPMFAIMRGRYAYSLMEETVRRVNLVWGVMLGITLVELLPALIEFAFEPFASRHFPQAHPAVWRVSLALLQSLWVTWLVLLKTDVAVQVLDQEPMDEWLLGPAQSDFSLHRLVENDQPENLVKPPNSA